MSMAATLCFSATSAHASSWWVSVSGASSSSCGASSAPCSLSYALSSKAVAGDTLILTAGTYSPFKLSASNHQNLKITGDPQIISDLGTFTRGIPSGTDNRPTISGRIDVSAAGASVSYLRIKGGSSPFDGSYDGVIGVSAERVTLDHNELWNGNQGIQVNVKRLVTINQNHIHNLGSMSSSEDTHGVAICGNGTIAAGWSEAITISNNSIHDAGGDAVQEMTNAYCSGTFQYLVIANNDLYNNQEQGFDSKGTSDVKIYGNNIYNNGEGGIVATNDPVVVSKMRWEIYNNRIHDHQQYAINWAQNQNCGAWTIYNNLIYNNVKSPAYNEPAVSLCGDAATKVYNNVFYNNTDTSGANKTGGIKDWGSGAGIINNIFYNNGTGSNDHGAIWSLSGEDSGTPSYNYIYPTTCGSGSCKTGTNVKSSCYATGNCPGFVNIAAGDFRLLSGSPAVNAGTVLGVTFSIDIEGSTRGLDGAWDLGAYEFGGGVVSGVPGAPTGLHLVP